MGGSGRVRGAVESSPCEVVRLLTRVLLGLVASILKSNPEWPLAKQYRARLLKNYLGDVDEAGEEVHEELLARYLMIANAAASKVVADIARLGDEEDREEVFRIYELADGRRLPIRERQEFKEVAEAIWPAGLFLAEWLIQNPDALRGKRILELGCGVGVTGVFLLKTTEPERLVLTDYSLPGLLFARENLTLNGFGEDAPVRVMSIDWTTFSAADAEQLAATEPIDVILVADCWYDIDIKDAHANTVYNLCQANRARGCYCLNASAIRNARTYQAYHSAMTERGFVATEVSLDRSRCVLPGSSGDRYAIAFERFCLQE